MSLLFKITYGLYMLSAKDGENQSGCIVNTVMQQTSVPETVSVTVNKGNYTHDLILKAGGCAVSVLDTSTKFEVIKNFGMTSGRSGKNKFDGIDTIFTKDGIRVLSNNSLGYMQLKVVSKTDLGSHTMFVCSIEESVTTDSKFDPLSYAYYHAHVKPKPQAQPAADAKGKEVWTCMICSYEHDGEPADDFICPLCKHGKVDFRKN